MGGQGLQFDCSFIWIFGMKSWEGVQMQGPYLRDFEMSREGMQIRSPCFEYLIAAKFNITSYFPRSTDV